MKKIRLLPILLGLCMLLARPLSAAVFTQGDLELSQIVSDGEAVLLLCGGGDGITICRFDGVSLTPIGESTAYINDADALTDDARVVLWQQPDMLIASDAGLYALSSQTMQLHKWRDDDFEPIGAPLALEDAQIDYFQLAAVSGGLLYTVHGGDDANGYTPRIITFDIATGEGRISDVNIGDFIMDMVPYKDGKVLVMRRSEAHGDMPIVQVFDQGAACEVLAVLEHYGASGLCYEAHTGLIYYGDSGQLFALAEGKAAQVTGYVSDDFITDAALKADAYMYTNGDRLVTISKDPDALPEQVLTIQCILDDAVRRDFERAYPDIPLIAVDEWNSSAQAIGEAIKTGDKSIDIFRVDMDTGLRAVIDKGYAQDLSASQTLVSTVNAYYPAIKQSITDAQGQLMAVPLDIQVNNLLVVDADRWAALDLGEYPTTYSQLIDLIARWEDEFAADNPDYCIMSIDTEAEFIQMVITSYIEQYEQKNRPLVFDTPALREVLMKIDALTLQKNIPDPDEQGTANANFDRRGIISCSAEWFAQGDSMFPDGHAHVLAPLVFSSADTASLYMSGLAFIVNPESENRELAIRFLETYIENSEVMNTFISPSLNEPIREEGFDEGVQIDTEALASLRAQLEGASEADRTDIEDGIARQELALAMAENRWLITQKGIDRFRELDDSIRVVTDSVLLSRENGDDAMREITTLMDRYVDGQLTLDAFIRELDQKANMIYLEGR